MTDTTAPQPPPQASPQPPAPPHLLDPLRLTARQRGHSEQTVAALADWSDRVYYSADAVFDAGDVLLLSEPITAQTPLATAHTSVSAHSSVP